MPDHDTTGGRWVCGPSAPTMRARDVHVWAVDLVLPDSVIASLRLTLSEPELQRARAFRRVEDYREFVACRALVRHILARYTSYQPATLQLTQRCGHCGGAHGKPRLTTPYGTRFDISWSRTSGMALFAIGASIKVGVDVERLDTTFGLHPELEALALSRTERCRLVRLSPNARRSHFYSIWTCKEAYLKAREEGLSRPPSELTISSLSGWTPVGDARFREQPVSWHSLTVTPASRYRGAVAVELPIRGMWQWRLAPTTGAPCDSASA